MRKFIGFFIVILFLSLPVWANDKPVLDEEICKHFVVHKPKVDDNGQVKYKAGVDVNGNPVIEADVTPSIVISLEEYNFPLTIDMAKYIGMDVPAGIMGEARLGSVTVKNGEVKFNGQTLDEKAEIALKDLCDKETKAK